MLLSSDDERLIETQGGNIRFFILSSGKTGGSSLYTSFKNVSMHLHGRNCPGLFCNLNLIKQISIEKNLAYIRKKFNQKPLIITSIRDPVYRTISSFFQNITIHMNKSEKEILKCPVSDIIDKLLSVFVGLENYYTYDFIKEICGIDIMSHEFDKDIGYHLYENDIARVLVLKFERINEWETMIRNILYPNEQIYFNWNPSNLSSDEWYGNIYSELKNTIKFSSEMIEKKFQIHKKFLEHFYNDDEIKITWNKWKKIIK
jgi:hypothetical protein